MPYVIVEGIIGGIRQNIHQGDESESNSTKSDCSYSPRQGVERSQMQKTKQSFYVAVSGLKANEIADLRNFSPGVDKDNYTITFPQHPCVILNALEVLGFRVISSSPKIIYNTSTSNFNGSITEIQDQPHHQSVVWTLRKEFEG